MNKVVSFLLMAALILNSAPSQAVGLCSGVFADEGSREQQALDLALKKAIAKDGSIKGLSPKDLELIAEKVFKLEEGDSYQASHYWKLTAEQRTLATLSRQMGQDVVHKGLLKFFEDNGYLVDKNRLYTKLSIINRSPLFNSAQAAWTVLSIATHGVPPVMLPEVFFKIRETDKATLLLKGYDSPEGREIVQRYGLRQEVIRGYSLFSKYYTRVALAVLIYIVYDRAQQYLDEKEKHENLDALEFIFRQFQKLLEYEAEP